MFLSRDGDLVASFLLLFDGLAKALEVLCFAWDGSMFSFSLFSCH